jgi:tetratricopeptide (TPR) repeat protein
MLGTPLYMSPEQAAGSEAVDHRADLWSLGVMVFECLTGRRLFEVATLAELLEALREGELPVPSRLADVPPGFDAWFNRAVARDVQARFQSASMLVEELAQALAPDRTRRAPLAVESDPHTALHVESGEQRTVRRMPGGGPVLFGRGRALLAIEDAFAEHARVVTLCGARGTGRRALARAHAAALAEVYAGGVWPCPLGGCADAEAMWRRFAAALGMVVDDAEPTTGLARAAAALGRALVIFERVERVREHLAPVVRDLLRGAPQLRIVVTADAPLSVVSERVIEVGGLSVPPVENEGPHVARSSAAMRMLGESMRVAWDGHSPEVIAACASVVRRLSGHPLAIRLLGTTAIPVADLAPRLTAQALAGEAGPDRAVREAAAVAFDGLPGAVRRGLIELSCFRGAFTVEAAEQVVSEEGAAVVAELPRLALCGWLESDKRLSMPPMIRKVCGSHLRDRPRDALALFERHGRLFSRSGEEEGVGAILRRGGLGLWTRALDDAEDVAAALERAKKRSSHDVVLRCARALGVVELALGRNDVAARLFLVAMSSAAPTDPLFSSTVALRVRALIAAGRYDNARELATRTAVHAPPPMGRALAQALLAYANAELAAGGATRALDAARRARDVCVDLDVVADADVLRARAGDPRGRELLESAAAIYRTLGESLCGAEALELLGRLDEAIEVYRRLGARLRLARVLLRRAAEGAPGDASRERDRQEAATMLAELGMASQLVPAASTGP